MGLTRQSSLLVAAVVVTCTAVAAPLPDLGPRFAEACARFEREVGPLDPSAYAPPEVPAERNAAIPVTEAIALLDLSETDRDLVGALCTTPTAEWTRDQTAALRAVLLRNDRVLSRVRLVLGRPSARFDLDHSRPVYAHHPQLLDTVHLKSLIVADGRLALDDRKFDRVVEDVAILGAIARAVAAEPFMIEYVVARSFESSQLLLLRDSLTSDALDRRALNEIGNLISQDDLVARLETATIYDCLGLTQVEAELATKEKREDVAKAVAAVLADYVDQLRLVALGMRAGNAPSRSMLPPPPDLDNESDAIRKDRKMLWEILNFNIGTGDDNWNRAQEALAARKLARVALAVRAEGISRGRYPDRLDTVFKDGKGIDYNVDAEGRAVLSSPVARELHKFTVGEDPQPDRYTWSLPRLAPPSPKLELAWSLDGAWTGVASDDAKRVIYALGLRGTCVELNASGKTTRSIDLPGVFGNTLVRLARFQPDEATSLLTFGVWRDRLRAYDSGGRLLWSYPTEKSDAIDDVGAADLDGDGRDEVIVGFNAGTGLHVLDHAGKLLWKSTAIGDVWYVSAGKVLEDRQMQVVTTDGGGVVHTFGADGQPRGDLKIGCHAHLVRTAGPSGQLILATCAHDPRTQMLQAVAGDGTAKWLLTLPSDAQPEVVSAGVTRDGRWVALGTQAGAVYVVDVEHGEILASVDFQGHSPEVAWAADEPRATPLLLVATGHELNAFRLLR